MIPSDENQAFYRYPKFLRDGSPYGGQGLQVTRFRYFRYKGGVYVFGRDRTSRVKSKGSGISF